MVVKNKPDRKYNRLPDYDYTSPAYYFVTICTKNKQCYFGEVKEEEMALNEFGKIVQSEWERLFNKYPLIRQDYYVVMPNHFHGVLIVDDVFDLIKGIGGVGTAHELSLRQQSQLEELTQQSKKSLSTYIGEFKMLSSKKIHQQGLKQFKWQRSFYDRIIRNEIELSAIRYYIDINPLKWDIEKSVPENLEL